MSLPTNEEIRKAYFDRKLGKLLDSVQAEGATEEELGEIEKTLEELRTEELKTAKRFSKFEDKAEPTPPTVDELRGTQSAEQKEVLAAWVAEAEKAIHRTKQIMKDLRDKTKASSNIKKDEWLNAALEISTWLIMIDQHRVYCDQLYRERLTAIIDDFELSRAEAEERAKLTKEYRDYKNAVLFRENLNEFVMLCKKYYGVS